MDSDMFKFPLLFPFYVDICVIRAMKVCGRLVHGAVAFGTLLALLFSFSHVMQT